MQEHKVRGYNTASHSSSTQSTVRVASQSTEVTDAVPQKQVEVCINKARVLYSKSDSRLGKVMIRRSCEVLWYLVRVINELKSNVRAKE